MISTERRILEWLRYFDPEDRLSEAALVGLTHREADDVRSTVLELLRRGYVHRQTESGPSYGYLSITDRGQWRLLGMEHNATRLAQDRAVMR